MSSPLAYPIILIHGYMDDPTSKIVSVWKAMENMLRAKNIEFLTIKMPRFGSVLQRSESCMLQIREHYEGKTVHLIAHSMGGLNARDIAARPDKEKKFFVKSVITYGTPHKGVPLIDQFLSNGLSKLAHETLALGFQFFISDTSDHKALNDMSCKSTAVFNDTVHNRPDVVYCSWAGQISHLTPHLLSGVQALILEPSDGLIEVSSARGTKDFTFLGTLEGVDHVTMMGPENVKLTIPVLESIEAGTPVVVKELDNSQLMQLKRRVGAVNTVVGGLFSGVIKV